MPSMFLDEARLTSARAECDTGGGGVFQRRISRKQATAGCWFNALAVGANEEKTSTDTSRHETVLTASYLTIAFHAVPKAPG